MIDDAIHLWSHQILSLKTLLPLLQPSGIFILEDIHTSYAPLDATFNDAPQDAATIACALAHLVIGGGRYHRSYAANPPTQELATLAGMIDTVTLYRSPALFVKKAR